MSLVADTARWLGGAGLVIALHLGVGQWIAAQPRVAVAPPDAVVVDLVDPAAVPGGDAPADEAAAAVEAGSTAAPPADAAVDETAAPPVPAAAPATPAAEQPGAEPPKPEPPPVQIELPPLRALAPLDAAAAPAIQPAPDPVLPALDPPDALPADAFAASAALATSDLPRARPERVVRQHEQPRAVRRVEGQGDPAAPQAEPRSSRRKPAPPRAAPGPSPGSRGAGGGRASAGPRNAGAGGSGSGASPRAQQDWAADAGAKVRRHMQRTRLPGVRERVSVALSVTVSASGAASGRLAGSTGNAAADAAIARQAGRLPRLPPPPGGRGRSFTVPIVITPR